MILGALFAFQACAEDSKIKPNPYAKENDSWISISGTVVAPTAESFTLDYGDGVILVEMDDWDAYGEAYALMDGDRVTVYGDVDADLFERVSIEADSVYVENLNTYFYASSTDEEGTENIPYFWSDTTPLAPSRVTIRGKVSSVDTEEREFTLNMGDQMITVETSFLGYNPLDELGYQKIAKGDRVSVSGRFDINFLEGREFEAQSVTTLMDASESDKAS
jgi:uncharacterized protein YdeI (BOF family)